MSDDSGLSVDGPSTFRGAVILLLVGLAATGVGAYDYDRQSEAVANSVEVDAEIVETGVETDSAGSSSSVDHRPTVRFTYTYDGTSYASSNLFPAEVSQSYDTESEARSVLAGYERGDTVTAYVVPDEPGNAFLKNQTSNAPLVFLGVGLFFVVVGAASATKHYRRG
ncbi:Protein of unknown function [Halopelagius inordinatus]|uniref:DUF3592 domain-containing protein n=1 Tax=Halopelagius inordinatus TaxID=553467 RepID=A0A1I2VWL4_9EURY|nr:DUF3592 domain-containing protein [Halopelagius inordinatus]SFG92757.1 Protein of unknown function [Halopelagius inordinatus]